MSNATTGGRMRGFFVRYILALTVLWVVILRVTDLLPKEGELIPRGGAWRPATEADCLQSFLSFTCGWYFGALARPSKPQVAKPKTTPTHADLIDGLGALGLVATPAQVGEAVAALYPAGVNGTDWGQVLRAVFLRLKASGHGR